MQWDVSTWAGVIGLMLQKLMCKLVRQDKLINDRETQRLYGR